MATATKRRAGNIKVTREDWLSAARDVLVSQGVEQIKVLSLANQLNVARSSFYWYFEDRADILAALLEEWENRNTRGIVEKCASPADNISQAACHFFECFIDPALFDQGLDFAVREWSRRDDAVRAKIDTADQTRISALIEMFQRHGYSDYDADTRARIIYFMQLGYHALNVDEPMDLRMSRLDGYVKGFTGKEPDMASLSEFKAMAVRFSER